nr:immunoglobulin light chain junction region [Macaca mulatta]MPO03215.1 immunoglobulin light chain junction region [Macaca mulatta]MPO03287.1 immunoglobulin light chain junction region [Macaca mulatta]MPO03648.1 immunoglobulin light chain junction region [Macaca mulatta]MPO03781.1 immunoglobulin light chain junction region [Macaca mulatta]
CQVGDSSLDVRFF